MQTDVAVVGGGLAGSMTASMLGRAGYDVVHIDPHDVFPPDFRCEKLEQGHIDVLRRTGLAQAVIRASTHTDTLWIARFGRLVDQVPFHQYGMAYDCLVNTVRGQVPPDVKVCRAWATGIETSDDRQRVALSQGQDVDARLVVLANGLNWSLREALGVRRRLVSPCHSITIGFDLVSLEAADFAFPALQYNPERGSGVVGYLTLFRIGSTMRANLFLYTSLDNPAVAAFRTAPDQALRNLLPGLARLIGDFKVEGRLKVRPTDLYEVEAIDRPGIVMIGDAFATPCPATGTGSLKVFNDVERLCNHHIPRWLASPGMAAGKLRSFTTDPRKVSCDAESVARAYALRAVSVDPSLYWDGQRWLRYLARRIRWTLRSCLGQGRRLAAIAALPRPQPVGSTQQQ